MNALTISLTDPKGGVGKSSIALNMAFCLATTKGKKTLLIEADKQMSIGDFISLRDVFVGKPLPFDYAFCDGDVRSFVQSKLSSFDYIIVDTAGRDSIESRSALLVSDLALCPVTASMLSLTSFKRFVEVLQESAALNDSLRALVLLNKCSTSIFSTRANRIGEYLSAIPHCPAILNHRILSYEGCFEDAWEAGLSIFEHKHKSAPKVRRQMTDAINEILLNLDEVIYESER